MSSTGAQIRAAVCREINRQFAAQGKPRPYLEVINSGTSAAAITDATRLLSTRYTPQQFQDWAIRVLSATGSEDGDLTYARALTPSTGALAVSPSFSDALAANDTLEMFSPEMPHPDTIDQTWNDALQTLCTRWRLTPLSWLQDADFLYDAVDDTTPTYWPKNGTGTVTIEDDRAGLEKFSERVLRMLAPAGGSDYAAQTVNRPRGAASGGEVVPWFFWMMAQAEVGTAALVAYDVTNSAALTLSGKRTSWDGEAFNIIKATAEPPATCEEMSVRLTANAANDDTFWANVIAYPTTAREFVLPSRVTSLSQVGRFVEIFGEDWPEAQVVELAEQPDLYEVGGKSVRAVFPSPVGNRAIFFEEFAYYPALQTVFNTAAGRVAGDVASTDCDINYVKWAALHLLFPGDFEREYRKWHREKGAKPTVRWQRRGPVEVSA